MSNPYQDLLTATLNAITALTVGGAKSLTLEGRVWTANNLPELWAQHDKLVGLAAAANAAGKPTAAVVEFGPRRYGRNLGYNGYVDEG